MHGPGVPLCDIQGQYKGLEEQIQQAVKRVLTSGQVILGPEVARLEEEIARYCGAGYGVGCASGSDALLLAVEAPGGGARGVGGLAPVPVFAPGRAGLPRRARRVLAPP